MSILLLLLKQYRSQHLVYVKVGIKFELTECLEYKSKVNKDKPSK